MGKDLSRLRRYREDRQGFLEALLKQTWLETRCGTISMLAIGVLVLCHFPSNHMSRLAMENAGVISAIILLLSLGIPTLTGANLQNDAIRLQDFEEYERKVLKYIDEDAGNA